MDTSLEHEFDLAQLELQSRQLHQRELRTSGFIFDDDNERRDRKPRRQTESDIQSIIRKWIQKDHKEIHVQPGIYFENSHRRSQRDPTRLYEGMITKCRHHR